MAEIKQVLVPDIGDYKDVSIIEVMVKAGDTIKAEDNLVTLETDKAAMDVPSPYAGLIKEMKVKVGDKVSQGSLILLLESSDAATAQIPPSPPSSKGGAVAAPATPPTASATLPTAPATPPTAPATPPTAPIVQVPVPVTPAISPFEKGGAGGFQPTPARRYAASRASSACRSRKSKAAAKKAA